MIDPVDLDNFFTAFFSAAMVIFTGAAYALFFAFAKLQGRKLFSVSAYLSYGLLTISVFFLSNALNLNGYWQILVWLMLAGYLLAPHGIWHLCRGTHESQVNLRVINKVR
ncbi:hypothetical protein [Kaarinaea lacus]